MPKGRTSLLYPESPHKRAGDSLWFPTDAAGRVIGPIRLPASLCCELSSYGLKYQNHGTNADVHLVRYLLDRKTRLAKPHDLITIEDPSRTLRAGFRCWPAGGCFLRQSGPAGLPITKLNGSHVYDLMHTFATRAAERGMPLPLLAKMLGHANMRSIEKYVHPTQPALDSAMLRYGQGTAVLEEKRRPEVQGTLQ